MARFRTFLTSALFAVLVWAAAPAAALEAGAAACDITPDVERYEVPMAGYGARQGKPSVGVHDPLQAKVLYLREGETHLALITSDLRSVTPELKQQIIEKAGIAELTAENVMVAASHNHSGPSLYREKFWQLQFGEYDPAIVEEMSANIALALRRAVNSAAPAQSGFAYTGIEGFTRNRRWGYDTESREAAGETPVIDERLSVLRIDSGEFQPLALLVHFPTHPTILGADNFEISAEWPGVLQDELKAKFPGATVLYMNGAEGDQAPAGASGEDDFERVADFGSRVAVVAAALARAIRTEAGPALSYAYTRLPLGEPVFSAAAQEGRYAFMQPFAMDALPRHAVLQQFRVGGVVVAALPGEPIAEVGFDVERRLKALGSEYVLIAGLANDYIGYILNAEEYAHGGYEVDSRSFYGPELGERIAAGTAASAKALYAGAADGGN